LTKAKGLSLKKKDPVREHVEKQLAKFDIKEETEIVKVKTLVDKLKESKSGATKVEASGDAVDLPKITKITAEVKKPDSKEAEKEDDTKNEKETEGEPEVEEKKRPRRKGALDLDLFLKVKEMLLCCDETVLNENSKHSVNMLMVEREGTLLEAGKGGSF